MSYFLEEKHIIYFDLETNGNRPFYKSAIMQMALECSHLKIKKNIYVQPYDGIIGATDIHQIDEEKLKVENAITSNELVDYLVSTFSKSNVKYYFLAYNNFGFDQNVLENHFQFHKMKVPQNWYFVDIMPYIQRYYPDIRKSGGYKLSNVYNLLSETNKKEEVKRDIQFHTAHDDVYCLSEICKSVNPTKSKISPYIRGSYTNRSILLSPISSIAGYAHFFNLEENNMNKIEDLYEKYESFMENNGKRSISGELKNDKSTLFKSYLKTKIGIYSDFYLNKITEQMEVCEDLLGKK